MLCEQISEGQRPKQPLALANSKKLLRCGPKRQRVDSARCSTVPNVRNHNDQIPLGTNTRMLKCVGVQARKSTSTIINMHR
eukprot:scaffold80971_cov18-Prasinocladus_malaysianus.AAC.1